MERVVGQDEAVSAVARAVRLSRAGLTEGGKPIASFLFLGPTGVGKTELAKALAAAVFGDENQLVRIDMSEYAERHTVSQLVGSPPGYVGYEEGGQLTERVRVDEVVVFHALGKAQIRSIVDLQLARVQRTAAGQNIELSFDDSLRDHLADIGYDPEFGARM